MLKVVLGIRIMIEEIVYNRLPPEHREGYLSTHKVINKLNYVEELGVVIPELYYLLNPIYNDPLHFKANNRDEVIKKFKAVYLKLYNYHVKHMIKMIWHDLRLQNEKIDLVKFYKYSGYTRSQFDS